MNQDYTRQRLDVTTDEGGVHASVVMKQSAVSQADPRVVLMIAGTLANGARYFDVAQGSGFCAAELLADAGFIVVMPDLPGTGESFRPADGKQADAAMSARALTRVAAVATETFGVRSGIDVYGEAGTGTYVAMLLSRETWVRTVVLSSPSYTEFGPATAMLFTPEHGALLSSLPDGYVPQNPHQVSLFFGAAEPLIRDVAVMACMGPAPQTIGAGRLVDVMLASGPETPTTLRLARPVVPAEPARAPALVLQGTPDFVGSEAGTAELVAAYGATGGGRAELVVIPGASHLMRFDQTIGDGAGSPFWSPVLRFLRTH